MSSKNILERIVMKAHTWFRCLVASGSLLVLLVLLPAARAQTVIHVKPDGSTTWPCGEIWENACELQTALTSAAAGDEIWAAAGTYRPGTSRADTFQLVSGVGLYGGFAGTETSREQRDWETNLTVLSGDIGVEGDSSDNSYHVVTGISLDTTTLLDGFTITGGNANVVYNSRSTWGGGAFIMNGSPKFANLIFDQNQATSGGGLLAENSDIVLTNTVFTDNQASSGGGIYFRYCLSPSLTDAIFYNNRAEYSGGGIWFKGGDRSIENSKLSNVIFERNQAEIDGGGGMRVSGQTLTLTNVIFNENSAGKFGGGLLSYASSITITDSEFSRNQVDGSGGGIYILYGTNTLNNVVVRENFASVQGGGIDVVLGTLRLNNVLIKENIAHNSESDADNTYGGGICAGVSVLNLSRVTFQGNRADYGGGLYSYVEGGHVARNNILTTVIFSGNSAKNGGGMCIEHSIYVELTNVTFSNNVAYHGGGISNLHNSYVILTNTIFWENKAVSQGAQIFSDQTSSTLVSYSDIQGGCSSIPGNDCNVGGNIESDPRFIRNPDPGPDGAWGTDDDDYGDLRLKDRSPAIDAGDRTVYWLFVYTSDLDGNPRFFDVLAVPDSGNGRSPVVDMGAYEAQYVYYPIYLPIANR